MSLFRQLAQDCFRGSPTRHVTFLRVVQGLLPPRRGGCATAREGSQGESWSQRAPGDIRGRGDWDGVRATLWMPADVEDSSGSCAKQAGSKWPKICLLGLN